MSLCKPIVSVGLPVYNGEDYVSQLIESIVDQTFTDFELVISDNASTDGTGEICRHYASSDRRIRYVRNPENVGLVANFNRVFKLSKGKYFKWVAHDDVYLPDFLSHCIRVLDEDHAVVLCYSRTIEIDAQGKRIGELDPVPELCESAPHRRFRAALGLSALPQLWGLSRSDIMGTTPLLGNYVANDGPYLSGLSLLGRFHEIPEGLFLHRQHEQRTGLVFSWLEPHKAIVAYDPSQAGRTIFPEWRLLSEHVAGINRARLGVLESIRCYAEIFRWMRPRKRWLLRDLIIAGQRIRRIGPLFDRIYHRYFDPESTWVNTLGRLETDIRSVIPLGESIILVDETQLGDGGLNSWRITCFLERNGTYWGLPPDDKMAINELERLRRRGVNFIVFAWPCFWWFDHYADFNEYLRSKYECVLNNNRLVVYDLRLKDGIDHVGHSISSC